jgi:GT2 family glycosyltransferase
MSISVISACKNRTQALSISLSSWVLFDEIDEIIITDWSSDIPVKDLTKLSKKIKVITVENQKYFNQPQPLNLAASISKGDSILKLDSDTILNPYYNFFDHYKVGENDFITGYYSGNFTFYKHLWGTLFLTRNNFNKIGGYNEHMGDYVAWEDTEIVERLEVLGLEHRTIDHLQNHAISLPHGAKERIENFKAYHENTDLTNRIRNKLVEENGEELADKVLHRALLETHNIINSKAYKVKFKRRKSRYYVEPVIKWEVTQLDDQNFTAQKLPNK